MKCIQCFFVDTLDFWKKLVIILKHTVEIGDISNTQSFIYEWNIPFFICLIALAH